jgi:hypothetical protein
MLVITLCGKLLILLLHAWVLVQVNFISQLLPSILKGNFTSCFCPMSVKRFVIMGYQHD